MNAGPQKPLARSIFSAAIVLLLGAALPSAAQQNSLRIQLTPNGDYSIAAPGSSNPLLTAGVAARINHHWVRSTEYPHHAIQQISTQGYLGAATQWTVTFSGLPKEPQIIYTLRNYKTKPFADLTVTVHNSTGSPITVQDIRVLEAGSSPIAALGASPASDRVLSDSFSEDRPALKIHDLGDAPNHLHIGVGSQLIYNRESHQDLFVGALTSNRFLTLLKIHISGTAASPQISAYNVDSEGTTFEETLNSLRHAPAKDLITLSLPVAPGADMPSETVLLSAGKHYHRQLETYGSLIRKIHHARVSAPPLMGWWSWTAFYFGLNHGTALTNAEWESEHLRKYGYDIFHIDEGYDYARGEYVTPDASLFPNGMYPLEFKIRGLGLVPGIWTAPFEVSDRSWVYQHHPDWLVKNAQDQPIPAGHVSGNKDQLYILDTTNPGAQHYLTMTYSKLVREWGIHYIKLDFMDDSAIEGYHYKPHTTAMQAQRIGLEIIRKAVGNHVYLDKDGSAMLNPVGLVDYGRISQDTGHTFGASKAAASGIAARFYMDRNFYVSDPDAFSVSTQVVRDQSWHGGTHPLTYNEAKVSISLAAVAGGMFEIGDNLPSLEHSPRRLALIENRNLIDMVKLGKPSLPVDLMSYKPSDEQPSIFFLKESDRQSILTVFNWTNHSTTHTIRLASLKLPANGKYAVTSVFSHRAVPSQGGILHLTLPGHDVAVLKIVNQMQPAAPPNLAIRCPQAGATGASIVLSATSSQAHPALSYLWNFGDGVSKTGPQVHHAWTIPGDYRVRVVARGLSRLHAEKTCTVHISGIISTTFDPARIRRFQETQDPR